MVQRSAGFAFVDHTADIGLRAWGPTLQDVFEQSGLALATLMGATSSGPRSRLHPIHAEGPDLGGLLVAYLNELVFVCETAGELGLVAVQISRLEPRRLRGVVELGRAEPSTEGLAVKAATYHHLHVAERDDGSAEAHVFLDV